MGFYAILNIRNERLTAMWKLKVFSDFITRDEWIFKNIHKYQIVIVFVNNGYGVEYRPLKIIDIQ